jgi:ribosomal protein L12E/L44/L45/RPP1/RPP2
MAKIVQAKVQKYSIREEFDRRNEFTESGGAHPQGCTPATAAAQEEVRALREAEQAQAQAQEDEDEDEDEDEEEEDEVGWDEDD